MHDQLNRQDNGLSSDDLELIDTPTGPVYRLRSATGRAIRCLTCQRRFVSPSEYLGHACAGPVDE